MRVLEAHWTELLDKLCGLGLDRDGGKAWAERVAVSLLEVIMAVLAGSG